MHEHFSSACLASSFLAPTAVRHAEFVGSVQKAIQEPSQPLLHNFVHAAVRVLQVLALRGGQ